MMTMTNDGTNQWDLSSLWDFFASFSMLAILAGKAAKQYTGLYT